jgi:rhamnosyltransferase
MLEEIFAKTENIPVPYDFIATTDTDEKVIAIESAARQQPGIRKVIVRKVAQNRGRDMSSLFITCRDLFIDERYDLVCRLHTKKSPQVGSTLGNLFKRHMIDNILDSKGYVTNLLELLRQRPWIGVAIPPIVQISFLTLGYAWYANKQKTQEMAELLDIQVNMDSDTPVAAYGTMFWFRPAALRILFKHKWKWEDFNQEPHHVDGGLAHALERLIAYAAQDACYTTEHIITARLAAQNYTILEYKLDKLNSRLPIAPLSQHAAMLDQWKSVGHTVPASGDNGYPKTVGGYDPGFLDGHQRGFIDGHTQGFDAGWAHPRGLSQSMDGLLMAAKRSVLFRFPRLFKLLRPFYRAGCKVLGLRRA